LYRCAARLQGELNIETYFVGGIFGIKHVRSKEKLTRVSSAWLGSPLNSLSGLATYPSEPDQVQSDLSPLYAQSAVTRMSPADQRAFQSGRKPLFGNIPPPLAGCGFSQLREQSSQPSQVLMVVVAIVLLIACSHVANLMLARAKAGQKEIAVRLGLAPGDSASSPSFCSKARSVVFGGVLGRLLAVWSGRLLVGMLPGG